MAPSSGELSHLWSVGLRLRPRGGGDTVAAQMACLRSSPQSSRCGGVSPRIPDHLNDDVNPVLFGESSRRAPLPLPLMEEKFCWVKGDATGTEDCGSLPLRSLDSRECQSAALILAGHLLSRFCWMGLPHFAPELGPAGLRLA